MRACVRNLQIFVELSSVEIFTSIKQIYVLCARVCILNKRNSIQKRKPISLETTRDVVLGPNKRMEDENIKGNDVDDEHGRRGNFCRNLFTIQSNGRHVLLNTGNSSKQQS